MEFFKIKLSDLQFFSRIGVFEQERVVGNEFRINIEVEIDAGNFEAEDLTSSISYADIYEEVREIMEREWLLLETVAKLIGDQLRDRWNQILRGRIEVIKLCPPIKGISGKCGIEYLF